MPWFTQLGTNPSLAVLSLSILRGAVSLFSRGRTARSSVPWLKALNNINYPQRTKPVPTSAQGRRRRAGLRGPGLPDTHLLPRGRWESSPVCDPVEPRLQQLCAAQRTSAGPARQTAATGQPGSGQVCAPALWGARPAHAQLWPPRPRPSSPRPRLRPRDAQPARTPSR